MSGETAPCPPGASRRREAASGRTGRHGAPRPMDGVRVIDVATFLAAPFCGTLLAEFGAEVIKVEQPGAGDPLRRFGTASDSGDSLIWLQESRNKKSVTLDLRRPEGAELLRRLAGRLRRAGGELPHRYAGTVGDRLGGAAGGQSPAGHGTDHRVRTDRAEGARPGLRQDRTRLRGAQLPRRRTGRPAPHAGLDHPRGLSCRHLRRPRRPDGAPDRRTHRRRAVRRHRALRTGVPLPRRDGRGLRPHRLRARNAWGRTR